VPSRALELFEILSAAVARDSAGSFLSGRVALGVRTEDRDVWWTIELGAAPKIDLSVGPPAPLADARLFMGEAEAASLVDGGALDAGGLLRKQGDESLMRAFFQRYLVARAPHQIRSSAPARPRRK
jgi:hypothetical protein